MGLNTNLTMSISKQFRIYTFESCEILCLLKRKDNKIYSVNTSAIMSLWNHQLSATPKKKCFDLTEKSPFWIT